MRATSEMTGFGSSVLKHAKEVRVAFEKGEPGTVKISIIVDGETVAFAVEGKAEFHRAIALATN